MKSRIFLFNEKWVACIEPLSESRILITRESPLWYDTQVVSRDYAAYFIKFYKETSIVERIPVCDGMTTSSLQELGLDSQLWESHFS